MPLYTVIFTEPRGYTYRTRIRTPSPYSYDAITLAIQKAHGADAYWHWAPLSDTHGQALRRLGHEDRPATDIPLTVPHTCVTVEVKGQTVAIR